jgi:hypothetical protein
VSKNNKSTQPTDTDFIWKVHSYTNEYIRFADAKAGAVIAWCSALTAALFAAKAHYKFRGSSIDFFGFLALVAFLSLAGGH